MAVFLRTAVEGAQGLHRVAPALLGQPGSLVRLDSEDFRRALGCPWLVGAVAPPTVRLECSGPAGLAWRLVCSIRSGSALASQPGLRLARFARVEAQQTR